MAIGEEVDGTVQLVAWAPPYIWYEKVKGNAEDHCLCEDSMENLVEIMNLFMEKGALDHVFCYKFQFWPCHTAFQARREESCFVDNDSLIFFTANTPVFEVDPITLGYTRAIGFYNTEPRRESLFLISLTACATAPGRAAPGWW